MAQTKRILKDFFSLGEKKTDFISAEKAYSRAKYGRDVTLEDLLEAKMEGIKSILENKSSLGYFSAMIEVDKDLEPYIGIIKEKLEAKDYQVISISKDTIIDNSPIGDKLLSIYLLIFWKNIELKPAQPKNKKSS